MKQYSHLTRDERIIISTLFFKENRSINYIAKIINKNKSTISRELKRNTIYSQNRAHRKYIKRKNHWHIFSVLKYKSFTELFLSKFNKRLFGI